MSARRAFPDVSPTPPASKSSHISIFLRAMFTLNDVLQNTILLFIKGAIFIFCWSYLLDSIYKDLRSLSYTERSFPLAGNASAGDDSDGDLDMEPLPTSSSGTPKLRTLPSLLPATPRRFLMTWSQSETWYSSSTQMLAGILFSFCFEECCTLFFLVMCQALDVLDPRARVFHWHLSLPLLVLLVVVVIPLGQCLLFTYRAGMRIKNTRTRIALTAIPFILYLGAFSHVPLPKNSNEGLFGNAIVRMAVLGTFILGILSGFGAVSTAWSFQPFTKSSNVATEREVETASAALDRVRSDLSTRQSEAQRTGAAEQSGGWFSPIFSRGNASSALLLEIDGLQALESQMSHNLEALRRGREEANYRNTFKGRVWVIIGKVFAIYCVVRIISSIRNVLFGASSGSSGTSSPDIVTYLIARFAALFPTIPLSSHDIAAISRQISLLLVGCIVLSSVRAVLWQVGRLIKSSSRTIGASFMLLLLAQLMGTYLLSTLIQLASSFPPNAAPVSGPSNELSNALEFGDMHHGLDDHSNLLRLLPEYAVFGNLFDTAFLAAAALTSITIWAQRQLNRAEIFR